MRFSVVAVSKTDANPHERDEGTMAAKKDTKKKRVTVRTFEPEERDAYIFCRHRMFRYIPKAATWTQFRRGKIGQLSFHDHSNIPEEAKALQIDEFAAKLANYLMVLGYEKAPGTNRKIRVAVRTKDAPMTDLLDVVAVNFRGWFGG